MSTTVKPGLELLASCLGGDKWKDERPRLRKAATALVDDHSFNADVRHAIDSSGIEWNTAKTWRGVVDRLSAPTLIALVSGDFTPKGVLESLVRDKQLPQAGVYYSALKRTAAQNGFPHLINKPAASAAPTKGDDPLSSYDIVQLTKIIDTIVGVLLRQSQAAVNSGDAINRIDKEEAMDFVAGYFAARMGMTPEQANALKSVIDLRRENGSEPDEDALMKMEVDADLTAQMSSDMLRAADQTIIGAAQAMSDKFLSDGLNATPFASVAGTSNTTATNTNKENETMTETTNNVAELANITIDPSLKAAIDMMLGNATGGKLNTEVIQTLAKTASSAQSVISSMEATLERMQNELMHAQMAAANAGTPAVAGDGSFPTSSVKWVKASDVDWTGNGKKHPALDFTIPMWEHDGPHPLVPTIDPNYVFNFKTLLKVLTALAKGKNIWAHGLPGTGKTEFFMQVAARLNWPVVQVNLDENIERADYVGSTTLHNDGGATASQFTEGALLQAMRIGALFVNDEMDYGRSGVMYVLQRVLQSGKFLLTEDGGRLVGAHPMFRICATANTRGQGDELGCFPGARVQSNALLDRFGAWVEFNYLDPEQEQAMLEAKVPGLDKDFAKMMVSFAGEVREAFKKGEILKCMTPRGLLAMGEYYAHFSGLVKNKKDALALALDMAFLDSVPTDNKQRVTELAARTFSL